MAEDKPDEPDKTPDEPAQRIVRVMGGVNMGAKAGLTVRVRLLQRSPDADPELVEVARQMAQELKEKQGDVEEQIDYIPEAPLVLPDHK